MRLSNGEVLLCWPLVQHIITAGWTYNDGSTHNALDFRAAIGTPVFAAEDGIVTIAYTWNGKVTTGDTNSYGNMVKLKHNLYKDHTLETLYAHLNMICVKSGQTVKEGQIVGYSGNTGHSFGAHLHYEVRYNGQRSNPLYWLNSDFTCANDTVKAHLGKYTSVVVPNETPKQEQNSADTSVKLNGIDVSKYQGNIDWAKVKQSGYADFAMLRVGSTNNSGIYVDPYFEKNYAADKAQGIPLGAYFYTYAKDEATLMKELTIFMNALQGKQFQFPVAIDVEEPSIKSAGKAVLTALAKKALVIIEQKGFKPMLYTFTNFTSYLDMNALADYDTWIADYRANCGYTGKYVMWQYASTKKINGIPDNTVDVNYCYKNYTGTNTGSANIPTPQQKTITFNKGTWNIRKGAGTSYGIVGTIKSPGTDGKTTCIGYTDIVNGWYKTQYGYVGPAAIVSHT